VIGDGPIDLVFAPGSLTHLDVLWEEPRYRRFCERLGSLARVLVFDKRGMGLSDRVEAGTMGERMDDIRAVLDAVHSERAILLGASEGGPLCILFAAAYPERTIALLLAGAEVKEEITDDWPWGDDTRAGFEAAMTTLPDRWGSGSGIEWLAPSLAGDVEARRWLGRLVTNAATPRAAEAFMRVAFEIDVRHVLPSLRVPTLVVHRTGDRVCDVHNGQYLAQHIAGAEYVELPGVDHLAWVGDGVFEAIGEFLSRTVLPDLGPVADLRDTAASSASRPAAPELAGLSAEARASSLFAEGVVAAASGEPDAARFLLTRSAELAGTAGSMSLEARARLELARTLATAGERADADSQARLALRLMREAGDHAGAERAAAFLRVLDVPLAARRRDGPINVTSRELEILRLVAQGKSTDEMAGELVLSRHTVHRHVGNILVKLGVPSRAAAVAEAARSGLL
jgi:pimeloyl-ACP methyl ester carboxylesterase/DNA-binding CsgD family transcriptional regulator